MLSADGVPIKTFRNVETDGRNRLRDLAAPNRGALSAPLHGTPVPVAVRGLRDGGRGGCRERESK
jgi:hypothetical protein